MSSHSTHNQKRSAMIWPLFSNTFLLSIKVVVAIVTNSASVLAEVVNSATDLVGNIISLLSVDRADVPPDKQHPYGHGKIENLSGLAIAVIIFLGGAFAITREINHLLYGAPIARLDWAIALMAVSAFINIFASAHLIRVGKQTDSPAIIAEGRNLQTDIYTSMGALVGLALVRFTGLEIFDPIVGLIVSLLTLRVGLLLLVEAVGVLSDSSLPRHEEEVIEQAIQGYPEVLSFHKLRTRKSGSHRYLDVHIQIADSHSFVEAHRLTEDVEDLLRSTLPHLHPIVHTEPFHAEHRHINS